MTRSEVIAKCRKLNTLASSANVHEASLAAALCARLLMQHGLEQSVLAARPEDADEVCGEGEGVIMADERWQASLATRIATIYGCRSFTRGGIIILVGRKSNRETAEYMILWLSFEIAKLARAQGRRSATWLSSYKFGAMEAVCDAVRASVDQTIVQFKASASSSALICIDKALARLPERLAEADEWMRTHLNLTYSRGGVARRSDSAGLAAGRRDGAGIYDAKRTPISSGQRQLR